MIELIEFIWNMYFKQEERGVLQLFYVEELEETIIECLRKHDKKIEIVSDETTKVFYEMKSIQKVLVLSGTKKDISRTKGDSKLNR
ncbi:hypothetical protein PPL_07280 [Heterostelium album PN500]|uniref:Uncharacterized protein n=1 Tax=Heterostelium pallidum (strain ATCC 26659 / Pp 5 / PN500) TaxID=670386 RepID=D3BEW4_HETP5|nr:hypothetical protein PPL_07280 [Heterostelium album PN500]EFA80445.1 hypothetical protein PPL_07280 [Heterostelium album PN500]|eukprot:XP_020432565.1 hypothetical protein PPL_07280 [Heterostelium album PN500]